MKLGVITDGISIELEHAVKVASEAGLEYAELQFVWDKEIGDQTDEEIQKIKDLMAQYNLKVPCITRHNFVGLPIMTTEVTDEAYLKQMEGLKALHPNCQRTGHRHGAGNERPQRDDHLRPQRR